MRPIGRPTLRAQRALARTARGPLRGPWAAVYGALARLVARYLGGGTRHASVYLRGSVGSADFLPAVSDLDLAVLVDHVSEATSVRERYRRLERRLPVLVHAVDKPRVTTVGELRDLYGVTVYTEGLDGPARPRTSDRQRFLDRPGLYDTTGDWRPVSGRERRPPEPRRDVHQVRLASWLELLFFWKHGLESLAAPMAPHSAALCVKLVSEPTRILLWLTARERGSSRVEVLERAALLLPDEANRIAAVVDLARRLQRAPDPDFGLVLPLLVRLSSEIAAELERQVSGEGTTGVRVLGATGGPRIPLCDWRALTTGGADEGSFTLDGGSPADVATLRRAMVAQTGDRYRALSTTRLLLLPSVRRERMALRAVGCRVTDPVSFALVAGAETATFPNVPGWSALDWSRRAVAEHARRLPVAQDAGAVIAGARAGLFRESVATGDPTLTVTFDATARVLAERCPSIRDAAFAAVEGDTGPGVLEALRKVVLELPAFVGALDESGQDTTGARASSAIRRSTAGRSAITSSSH